MPERQSVARVPSSLILICLPVKRMDTGSDMLYGPYDLSVPFGLNLVLNVATTSPFVFSSGISFVTLITCSPSASAIGPVSANGKSLPI